MASTFLQNFFYQSGTSTVPSCVHPHLPILSLLLCLHSWSTCCFLQSTARFPGSERARALAGLKAHNKDSLRLARWLLALGAGEASSYNCFSPFVRQCWWKKWQFIINGIHETWKNFVSVRSHLLFSMHLKAGWWFPFW